jgi:hypothetical protein
MVSHLFTLLEYKYSAYDRTQGLPDVRWNEDLDYQCNIFNYKRFLNPLRSGLVRMQAYLVFKPVEPV